MPDYKQYRFGTNIKLFYSEQVRLELDQPRVMRTILVSLPYLGLRFRFAIASPTNQQDIKLLYSASIVNSKRSIQLRLPADMPVQQLYVLLETKQNNISLLSAIGVNYDDQFNADYVDVNLNYGFNVNTKNIDITDDNNIDVSALTTQVTQLQNQLQTLYYTKAQVDQKLGQIEIPNLSSYLRKNQPATITQQYTFAAQTPFILGTQQRGQLIEGLNADLLDGKEQSDFQLQQHQHSNYVKNNEQQILTNQITFQPDGSAQPFALTESQKGRLIEGLNQDLIDGKHQNDFQPANHTHSQYLDKENGGTITGQVTFQEPFVFSTNQQGQLILGLNADLLDGKHYNDIQTEQLQGQGVLTANMVKTNEQQTITVQHTFNTTGQPFNLGPNSVGQLVEGLNQQYLNGKTQADFQLASHTHTGFLTSDQDQSITGLLTFARAGQPFQIGPSQSGQLVSNLNAQYLDGKTQQDFQQASHTHSQYQTREEVQQLQQAYPQTSSANIVTKVTGQTLKLQINLGTQSGTAKFFGAVVQYNNNIYYIPYNQTSVLKFNTSTRTFSTIGTLSGTNQYQSQVLQPNGKIYCIPYDQTSILVIDTYADTVTTLGSFPGTGKWQGGTLQPNGKIYCQPHNQESVLVIDPVQSTTSTISVADQTAGKYVGQVLQDNGMIYCIPHNQTSVLKINPNNNTVSTFGTVEGSGQWFGGNLAPDSKIYCIPYNSNTILVINPLDDTVSTLGQIEASAPYTQGKWAGGILYFDTKIYAMPRNQQSTLVINPLAQTFSTMNFDITLLSQNNFVGGTLGTNGRIYPAAHDNTNMYELDIISTLNSGYFNKL